MALATYSHVVSALPIDWIVLGAILIVVALETLRSGANRACALALSLPAAMFLYDMSSHTAYLSEFLSKLTNPYALPGFFAVILVVTILLGYRIIGFYGLSSGAPIQSLLVGIATAVIVAVFWQISPFNALWHFGPQVQVIFGEAYRFWWVAGAYLALAFARG